MKNICEDCIYCNNYQVSELGCFGQSKVCEFYAGDNDSANILIKQDLKEKFDLLPDQTMSIQEIQSIIDKSIEKLKAKD